MVSVASPVTLDNALSASYFSFTAASEEPACLSVLFFDAMMNVIKMIGAQLVQGGCLD